MRVVRYHEFGGPDVLCLEETAPLDPRSDEVRVDVRACGVNPCDSLRREGLWGDDLPLIPGSDLAGVVEAVGDDAPFDVGDRVLGTVPMLNRSGSRGDRQGVYAERAVVRADRLARLPDDTGFEAGAALGLVGCTAWRALVELGRLDPGETCLVHGGSGGVGHVAVQLAAARGARVLATASEANRETVAGFGADAVFDYSMDEAALAAEVDAAAPGGVDVTLDHRFGDYAQFDVDVAAPGGRVMVIGGNHDQPTVTDLTEAIGKDVTIQPFDVFNLADVGGTLARLAGLVADGDLSASVARTYDLDEAAAAHRAVDGDSFVGKLVIGP
jgi:NADPH2:quinone reductase